MNKLVVKTMNILLQTLVLLLIFSCSNQAKQKQESAIARNNNILNDTIYKIDAYLTKLEKEKTFLVVCLSLRRESKSKGLWMGR